MSTRSKDGGKHAAKRKTGSKSEQSTTVEWYVDIMGLDDIELAENVFIGSFDEAVKRANHIAQGITNLVESGMPADELGVRMGVYRVVEADDDATYAGEESPPQLFAVVSKDGSKVLARGMEESRATGYAGASKPRAKLVAESLTFTSDADLLAGGGA